MNKGLRVGILGATGAVGAEFLSLFSKRKFPVAELRLLASERSAGKKIGWEGAFYTIESANQESFENLDVVFMSAGASRSKEFARLAIEKGAVVIDNSSAFRLDPEVPLIVPEVNGETLKQTDKLIANPNCTAAILLTGIKPILDLAPASRIIVSTYQSASGAGAEAMRELETQTQAVLNGQIPVAQVFPHIYAFNLFSHNTAINEHGYNDEEWKVIAESRKMLGLPGLAINVTCVRVPVLRAHTETVTIEFIGEAPSLDQIRNAINNAHGVKLVDDRVANHFPMPLEASGQNDVLIGRIRKDVSHPSAISLMISGDQLLKGAALNAVQIAELMIQKGYL